MCVANTSTYSPKTTHTRTPVFRFKPDFNIPSRYTLRAQVPVACGRHIPPFTHARIYTDIRTSPTLELIYNVIVIVASRFRPCIRLRCVVLHTGSHARMYAHFWFSIMIVMLSFSKASVYWTSLAGFYCVFYYTPLPLYPSSYVSSLISFFFFFFCRFIVMLSVYFDFNFQLNHLYLDNI